MLVWDMETPYNGSWRPGNATDKPVTQAGPHEPGLQEESMPHAVPRVAGVCIGMASMRSLQGGPHHCTTVQVAQLH